MKSELSVIIITRNEEADIEACITSVQEIAAEVVVVDSGSTDRTWEIVKKMTPHVYHHDWTGYGPQKQFALEKSTQPWILNIDADERISPELAKEIKEILNNDGSGKNGFKIPYRHYFLGRRLRFGGIQGETHLRLFRKKGSSYGDSRIHEGIHVPTPHGQCRGYIDHYSYRDLDEYWKKCEEYTSLIAADKFAKGQRFHFWHHFRLPLEFLKRYVFRLGFLDGGAGLTYAWLSSQYVRLKFLKLRDLENAKN